MNALRGLLSEYGAVFPVGLTQTKRIEAYVGSSDADLPALVVAECHDLHVRCLNRAELSG